VYILLTGSDESLTGQLLTDARGNKLQVEQVRVVRITN
jgi:hypothetical protein